MQVVKTGCWFVAALMALLIYSLPTTAVAFGIIDEPRGNWAYSVAFGVMDHDVDLDWASRTHEGGTDYNVEVLFNRSLYNDVPFGVLRPNVGVSINDQGDTSRVYAGALWQMQFESKLLFNIGMGLALHNGDITAPNRDEKQFGAQVVFRMPVEVGYEFNSRNQVLLVFEHMSNGSLADPNHGMDALGIRYRYRFR